MSRKHKFIILTIWILGGLPILFSSFSFSAYGQKPIGGIINTVSAGIDAVYGNDPLDVDSVHVNSILGFSVGDTVLIHMSVGASFYTNPLLLGQIWDATNSGKYAIFKLKDIDSVNNYLILNSKLPEFTSLLSGEFGQILKVPTYKRAVIKNTLTCNAFDTATHTGGIVALIVKQGLIFEANINVDGKGFPGADPDPASYNGNCSSSNASYLEPYLASSQSNFSALKGYSITQTTNDLKRGFGAANNGGGGGNGRFSGGGGGANLGNGGNGGYESDSCGLSIAIGGNGGKNSKSIYYESDNRISFGGGGGTSLQVLPSYKATSGGDGGGIVIVICDSLIGNNEISTNIYARGESVTDSATAGAGGGGGGGTIIIHTNTYTNSPKLWVTGGDGGSISGLISKARGPGGGGGSGAIWHNEVGMGAAFNNSPGHAGTHRLDPYGAQNPNPAGVLKNLKIPIRGFLFNYIPDADTICKTVPPNIIKAPPAIGGAGTLSYKWFKSSDQKNWVVAETPNDKPTFTPDASTITTTFYRRYVTDGFIDDSSNIVKMVVLSPLANNLVKPENTTLFDTIVCSKLKAGDLKQIGPVSGGNGIYRYMWEKSMVSNFATRDTMGASISYSTPVMVDTTWFFRRTVYSGPRNRMESGVLNYTCKSTSNLIKINVLPVIENNKLDSAQEICINKTPYELTGGIPNGGDNYFIYKWQQKTGPSTWTQVSTDSSYGPPALTVSKVYEYRRIIFSGNANTCKDTSAVGTGKIIVWPVIMETTNKIDPIVQNILCSGLNGDTLKASKPSGGDGNNYSYYWQIDSVNAASGNGMTNFNPGILLANPPLLKHTFRRIVFSPSSDKVDSVMRCMSISNEREIRILNNIENNSLSTDITTWCQGKQPLGISGTIPGKGDGTYSYSWVSKISNQNWTSKPETSQDLIPAVITSTISYRRVVKSGLNQTCKDTSNTIKLIMQDSILNNIINRDSTVFVCTDQDSMLQATFPGELTGGNNSYTYTWMQSSDSLGTYTEASHSNNSKELYQTEPVQNKMYFKRKVNSGDCENTSKYAIIEPLQLPVLTDLSVSRNEICYLKLVNILKATIQSGLPPYYLSFEDGQGFTDSRIFSSGSDSIKPVINDPNIDPGYIDYVYKIVSIRDGKKCYAKPSNLPAALRVYTKPVPSLIGDNTVLSCSDSLQLAVNKSIGASSWHLSNVYGISAANTNNPFIDLKTEFSTDDSSSVSLAYVEDIANCHSDTIHANAVLFRDPDPITYSSVYKVTEGIPVLVGDTVVVYISEKQQFKGETIVSGIPGWSLTGGGTLTSTDSIVTTVEDLNQENPSYLKYSISNGTCPVNTRTLKIERHKLHVFEGFSPNGDAANQKLWAIGLADEEVDFKFQIFSSSGSFLREITRKDLKSEDYDYGENQVAIWDGSTNIGGEGNYVPDGTYYYVLMVTYHGAPFNEKGYVIVKH
jgi:hypothetical protein